MRITLIAVLGCLLGFVYWLGATVYSERIERDISARTQETINTHAMEVAGISRVVDGRDVEVYGTTTDETARVSAGDEVRDVWGVRVAENKIILASAPMEPEPEPEVIEAEPFDFYAVHRHPNLTISGKVDEPAHNTATNIFQALPPATVLDTTGLQTGDTRLKNSPRIIETGVAALTQLNPGTLLVTDEQFILRGEVASTDRKITVEQLIETRRSELEPLQILLDIKVVAAGVPYECQQQLDLVLANNVINYAVNHYVVLDKHRSILDRVAQTVLDPCEGHIEAVLVEGHADFTGSDGYNQGLSERRSSATAEYLLNYGLKRNMVQEFGYGEFRPIASNETIDGRAKNRRTEIYLITNDKQTTDVQPQISTLAD